MKEFKLPKIFDLNYLMNEELTEDDLYHLFETESLNYSFIIEMFRFLNELTNPKKLAHDFHKNNGWINKKKFCSMKERTKFTDKLEKAIKNIYQYSDYLSKRWVDDWMFHYGFSVTNLNLK